MAHIRAKSIEFYLMPQTPSRKALSKLKKVFNDNSGIIFVSSLYKHVKGTYKNWLWKFLSILYKAIH